MGRGTYIFLGVLIVVGALALYWLAPAAAPQIDWRETYDPDSREPYGTYVLQQLLEQYHPALSVEVSELPPSQSLPQLDSTRKYTYFYIGAEWLLSDESVEAMYDFLEAGHDVLVISAYVGDNFYEESPVYYCQPDYWMTEYFYLSAEPAMYGDDWGDAAFYYQSGPDTLPRPYRSFTMAFTGCDSLALYTPLSYLNSTDRPNFVEIPVEAGRLYLHTNPILFTNYALKDSALFHYVDQVFGHIEPSTLLWDQYTFNNAPQDDPMQVTRSPLSFILSQRALRWAWWLLIIGALLFLLFRGKRQQKAIPVLQQPINRSLRFIQTIGQLHYNQKDHRSIARKQYQYWLLTCRQRFQEQPQYRQPTSMERLAGKSQAPLKLIREIAYLGENLAESKAFSTRDLQHFHQLMQEFYRYK